MTDEARTAVAELKKALVNAVTLAHRSRTSKISINTDASGTAVGGALHQLIDGKYRPVGFYSKRLSSTQAVYSTFDRELLAAYQAELHFKPVIEAQRTTLFTDHKALMSAFSQHKSCKV